jgi:EGF-like domain
MPGAVGDFSETLNRTSMTVMDEDLTQTSRDWSQTSPSSLICKNGGQGSVTPAGQFRCDCPLRYFGDLCEDGNSSFFIFFIRRLIF